MRITLVLAAIAAVVMAACLIRTDSPLQGRLEAEVLAPYVQVDYRGGVGAGTVIEAAGSLYVLTSAHLVSPDARFPEPPSITRFSEGSSFRTRAEVVWYTPIEEEGGNDLALLRPFDATSLVPVHAILDGDAWPGEDVWYIGTPDGVHARMERSIVACTAFSQIDRAWMGTNGCAMPGSSGGGLFVRRDGHYWLAGVMARVALGAKGMALAKPSKDVNMFLRGFLRHQRKGKRR